VGERVGNHLAPGGERVVDAEAQEAEAGLGEDGGGDAEGHRDDERRQGVGEQVADGDLQAGGAQRVGGQDEVALAQRQELGGGEGTDVDPTDQADRQDHVQDPPAGHGVVGAPDGDQEQGEEPDGDGGEDLDPAHDDVVDPAAAGAGQGAERQPDGQG